MGLLEIGIGCAFVIMGLKGKEFYSAAPGATRRWRRPIQTWEGRILFFVGGAVAILVGIHRIIHG